MRNTKRIIVAGVLALSLVMSSTGSIVVNKTKVEAKKKNTKPKLTLKGKLKKKKITIKEGQTIKINASAKDKEDGNLNKKIKITVKKPKNGKYKKTGKTIKFINDGTYKITVSVTDSNKAKASQTIKVIVKDKENISTNEPVPYVSEEPNKVVETPKPTVKPTDTPIAPSADLSKYGKIEEITVNGVTYNYCEELYVDYAYFPNEDFVSFQSNNFDEYALNLGLNIGIGNNSKLCDLDPEKILLYFIGTLDVKVNEVNCSDNVIFYKDVSEREDLYVLSILIENNGELYKFDELELYNNDVNYLEQLFSTFAFTAYRDLDNEFFISPKPINCKYLIDNVNESLT